MKLAFCCDCGMVCVIVGPKRKVEQMRQTFIQQEHLDLGHHETDAAGASAARKAKSAP